MKGSVLIFGLPYPSVVTHILNLGYMPLLVHDHNNVGVQNFFPLLFRKARNRRYDLNFVQQFKDLSLNGAVICHDYYINLGVEVLQKYFRKFKSLTCVQAEVVRDKFMLRATLKDYGIPTARCWHISITSGYLKDKLGGEYLVKPKNECSARGISLIQSETDWQQWLAKDLPLDDYYAEEYLTDFKEYCCDTIVADGKILAQFSGEYTVPCLESNWKHDGYGVNFPGFLPKKKLEELKALARKFVEKHGIKDGFCHMEFFYTKEGWKFGEIGWRLPGGYQIPTESYIAGTNILDLYLKIFIETEPTPQEPLNVENKFYGYYLYPKKTGRVLKIEKNLDYPWIVESKIYVEEGQEVPFEDSSTAMSAHVVYKANSVEELKKYSDCAKELITIKYEE